MRAPATSTEYQCFKFGPYRYIARSRAAELGLQVDFVRADVDCWPWMIPTSPKRRGRRNPPCVAFVVARDECVKDGEGRSVLG